MKGTLGMGHQVTVRRKLAQADRAATERFVGQPKPVTVNPGRDPELVKQMHEMLLDSSSEDERSRRAERDPRWAWTRSFPA
jgi:hypothetical protein